METSSRIEKFFFEDIIYITKQDKNVIFVVKGKDGERKIIQRANLKDVEKTLSEDPEFLHKYWRNK